MNARVRHGLLPVVVHDVRLIHHVVPTDHQYVLSAQMETPTIFLRLNEHTYPAGRSWKY